MELRGIVRHRNDQLLDPVAVNSYLSQIAPVPFSRDFRYGEQITDTLSPSVKLGNIQIKISGSDFPVYRPHRNRIELGAAGVTELKDLQFFTVPAVDGGTGAIGWLLHHAYAGAFPPHTNLKGLRVRVGNIQVGDERLLPRPTSLPPRLARLPLPWLAPSSLLSTLPRRRQPCLRQAGSGPLFYQPDPPPQMSEKCRTLSVMFAERPTGMQLHRDRQCDVKFSFLSIGRTF